MDIIVFGINVGVMTPDDDDDNVPDWSMIKMSAKTSIGRAEVR